MKTTRKIIAVFFLFVAIIFLGGCGKDTSSTDNTEASSLESKNKTMIYLVKVDSERNGIDNAALPGQDLFLSVDICTGTIVGVEVDGKLSPEEALIRLFTYNVDDASGMHNSFAKSKDIKVQKLIIKNNFAIVHLTGKFDVEESCEAQFMHDQIVKTLSQFDDIAGADIFVDGKELSGYIFDLKEK